MPQEKTEINLLLEDFRQAGLYLIFPDGSKLSLTKENIEQSVEKFWNDPSKISLQTKKAVDFQRCYFCPLKRQEDMCDAIRPTVPFLEFVDKYVSFDKVIAVFKGDNDIFYISHTTMQEALKYISLLSLMQYCQVGRTYWKYYFGIIPFDGGKDAVMRLYLNIYWLHKGNKEEIAKIITKFIEEIRTTSQNQVKRLNLICKKDAFMNAFVNTQIATEFLNMDVEKILESSFSNFEKSIKINR